MPQPITILPYDPLWSTHYAAEEATLRQALGTLCSDILHVGSTAVPGLPAKPILDIIITTTKVKVVGPSLEAIGYYYKGEYNLPGRALYKKKVPCLINLHVHRVGSAEVRLNLLFRDYLRAHPAIRQAYAAIKYKVAQAKDARGKVGAGLSTRYNLAKSGFIQEVLRVAGFEGWCMRLCTEPMAWEVYERIRKLQGGSTCDETHHLVLYQGTDVVAAAGLVMEGAALRVVFVGVAPYIGKEAHRVYLLQSIQQWVSESGKELLGTQAT